MTRFRRDKAGVRGVAPIGAIKCSPAPMVPKRTNVWSTKNETNGRQYPKLHDVVQHPGIKGALDLVDEGPPSWAWWREPIEEWCFEKEARELEELDSGDNDTVNRLGFGTGMWAEGPDIDPGVIGEPITRWWPTSIATVIQKSDLGRRASKQDVAYVLLEDEIRRRPAAHHAREGSDYSSTTSESSAIEDSFNVWVHVVREDNDEGHPTMTDGTLERDRKGDFQAATYV